MAVDRAPLVLVPQFFGSLVFDRRTSRYLPFDAGATAVLTRLREAPVEDLLAEAAGEEERGRIGRFFEHFYELGFFTVDGRFAGEVLDGVHVPDGHLTGPLAVHLEVVSACNLTCTHCFAGELPRRERRLTLDEIDRLFAEMAALGSFRLGLTGGEPLLRKDLFRIIDLALEHGLAPCVTTNGLLITEEIAHEVGAGTAVFRPLYPVGVARDHPELMPSFAEYNTALNTLARMDGDGAMELRHIDPFSPYSRRETQSVVHQNYGCGAGDLVCSISVSGDVNPCSFLGSDFVAANVRDGSLAEIWHHSAGFRALPHSEPSSERGHTATFAGAAGPARSSSTARSTPPTPGSTARRTWSGARRRRCTTRWPSWT